jgi:hypothetical protein
MLGDAAARIPAHHERLIANTLEAKMDTKRLCQALTLAALPLAAAAGEGLVPPAAESLWPQWSARIAVQTAELSPLTLSRLLEGGAPRRIWQGGSVLGDYTFATPPYGSFRASGGLMIGGQGGAPLLAAAAGPRLGLGVQAGGFGAIAGNDAAVPYLGLGFTGAAWRNALSVTADFGLVAEHASAASDVGRALFGSQGMDRGLREMRLSPVFQLGVRYTF